MSFEQKFKKKKKKKASKQKASKISIVFKDEISKSENMRLPKYPLFLKMRY